VGLPVEEAAYFVTKSRQVALLTATGSETLGDTISKHVLTTHAQTLINIPIGPALLNLPSINHTDMHIASSTYLSDNAASIVIFTSGTTGPPKGAVMRRAYVHDGAIGVIDHYDITSSDVILHVLPVHHATGIGITFTPFLFSGATIEFRSGSFDPAWMWERWRQGGLTFFSGVPTIYMRMMRFYEHHIAKLPVEERQGYVDGANQFRAMLCGSSALPTPIQEFWSNLRRGQKILTRYGATEFGAVFKVGLNDPDVPHGSVGKVAPGVDIKLSNGDEGEVLVRGPHMFSKSVSFSSPQFSLLLSSSSSPLISPRCPFPEYQVSGGAPFSSLKGFRSQN
jgi:malonyl-CoA/methylmalonyl-CoA synthetase